MKKIVLSILLFVCSIYPQAKYDITHYKQEKPFFVNNAPTSEVKLITIDKKNRKWFVCNNEIVVFDDTNWVYPDMSELPEGTINSIAVDTFNNIWIGVEGGGIAKFNEKSSVELFNNSNTGMPIDSINVIEIDEANIKWIGTENNGLIKFNDKNWQLMDTSNSGIACNKVSAIAIDEDCNVWVGGTFKYGISILDKDGKWSVNNEETNASFKKINTDILYCEVDDIIVVDINTVWFNVGYTRWDSYCYLLKLSNNQWEQMVHTGISHYMIINALDIDKKGNLYIGSTYDVDRETGVYGLAVYKDGGFQYYDPNSEVWDKYIYSNGLLSAIIKCKKSIVYSLAIDNYNNVWIGTHAGIVKLDTVGNFISFKEYKINKYLDGLAYDDIQDIAIDRENNKWIATKGGGVSVYNGITWNYHHTLNSELKSNYISSIAVDCTDNIWISSDSAGISFYDGEKWTTYDTSNSELPNNKVYKIVVGDDNTIWMSLGKEIVSLNNGRWDILNSAPIYNYSNRKALAVVSNRIYYNQYCLNNVWKKLFAQGNYAYTVGGLLDNTVYWGTSTGIKILKGDEWLYIDSCLVNALADDGNNTLLYSRFIYGNLNPYLCTYNIESRIVDTINVSTYTLDNEHDSYFIKDICVDQNGTKWVGTLHGLLEINDENSNLNKMYAKFPSSLEFKIAYNGINFFAKSQSSAKLEIFNIQGRLIKIYDFNILGLGMQKINIDFNALSTGFYIGRLCVGAETMLNKFMIKN